MLLTCVRLLVLRIRAILAIHGLLLTRLLILLVRCARLFAVGLPLLLMLLSVHLILPLIVAMHCPLLFQVRLPLIYRGLLVLLVLQPVAPILLMRSLPLLKLPVLLILLDHRVLVTIVLLLFLPLPVLMFSEPIRMVGRYPIRVLVVPPFAIMPPPLPVVCAVFVEPSRVERGPVLMMVIKRVGVVPMPPVGVAPLMLVVVVAPAGFGRSLRPVLRVQALPGVGMVLQVLLQC